MKTFSEILDLQTRGEAKPPNVNNSITKKRKAMKKWIDAEAGGNKSIAYSIAMQSLEDNITRLQEYTLSKGEEPAPEFPDLVRQVYQLWQMDIAEAGDVLDYDNEQAAIFLEDQEDGFEKDNGYVRDEFLGHLGAPLEIAYTYMKNDGGQSFSGAEILGAVAGAIGTKVNKQELIRAAQGKPAGVIGTLATGGVAHYNALRNYFRANPDVAKQVIDGRITDESQLPNWAVVSNTGNSSGSTGINKIIDPVIQDQFKKAIPYIIGFLLIIGVIVYFASRSKK